MLALNRLFRSYIILGFGPAANGIACMRS